jgi:hypothetical protein
MSLTATRNAKLLGFLSVVVVPLLVSPAAAEPVYEMEAARALDILVARYSAATAVLSGSTEEKAVQAVCSAQRFLEWSTEYNLALREAQLDRAQISDSLDGWAKQQQRARSVIKAIGEFLPEVADAVEQAVRALRSGGSWPDSAADAGITLSDVQERLFVDNINACSDHAADIARRGGAPAGAADDSGSGRARRVVQVFDPQSAAVRWKRDGTATMVPAYPGAALFTSRAMSLDRVIRNFELGL